MPLLRQWINFSLVLVVGDPLRWVDCVFEHAIETVKNLINCENILWEHNYRIKYMLNSCLNLVCRIPGINILVSYIEIQCLRNHWTRRNGFHPIDQNLVQLKTIFAVGAAPSLHLLCLHVHLNIALIQDCNVCICFQGSWLKIRFDLCLYSNLYFTLTLCLIFTE